MDKIVIIAGIAVVDVLAYVLLKKKDVLYGADSGPGGHVRDGTGPYGAGMGPGAGCGCQ